MQSVFRCSRVKAWATCKFCSQHWALLRMNQKGTQLYQSVQRWPLHTSTFVLRAGVEQRTTAWFRRRGETRDTINVLLLPGRTRVRPSTRMDCLLCMTQMQIRKLTPKCFFFLYKSDLICPSSSVSEVQHKLATKAFTTQGVLCCCIRKTRDNCLQRWPKEDGWFSS